MNTTLVFDYDGTIHDNMVIYKIAFHKTHDELIEKGIIAPETVTDERLSGWFGMNAKEMWIDFHPELPEEVRDEAALSISRHLIEQIKEHKAIWYDGAEEMLNTLKSRGYTIVMLSNCRHIAAEAQWEEFHLERWFDKWYDAESYNWIPKGQIMLSVMEEHPGKFIVIGDRISDHEAADAAGSPFIACMYGYARPGELDDMPVKAFNVREIPAIIEKISE